MSKSALKKILNDLDREQLKEVILEIYDARKDAREFLEYFVAPDEVSMYEKYKAIIHKEFFPAKGRAKARSSVCKKALKEFITLHPSPRLIANLRLYTVERATQYAILMRSWIKTSVENLRVSTFEEALTHMYANGILDESMPAVERILAMSKSLRHPIKDDLEEAYNNFLDNMR